MKQGRPRQHKLTPCPQCGQKRYRTPCGTIRCRQCHAAKAKQKYARKVLTMIRGPYQQQLRETWHCEYPDCGRAFQRSTQSKVLARFCPHCREVNRAADPTPEEIRQRCRAIQLGWTPLQTLQRMGLRVEHYEIEQYDGAILGIYSREVME